MTTDVYVAGFPLSSTGVLQITSETDSYPSATVRKRGIAIEPVAGLAYIADPASIASTDPYLSGIRLTPDGAMYVTESTSGSFTDHQGYKVRSDGAVLVSFTSANTDTFNGSWRKSATGAVVVGGGLTFFLDFYDAGSGVANLVPLFGGVSATFTRATAAWTNLSDGTIGAVASGSPRSYYSPTGTYLGYLAEGARTNLCQRGEDFSTVWTDVGTPTLSAGTTTLGVLSLSTLGDDDASALEGKIQTITFTGDAVKAIAVYVKKGTATSSVIRLRDTSAPADRLLAAITWNGTVPVVTMTTGTDLTGTPAQQGSSGVYRLLFATTSVTAANTNSLQIYPATDAALAVGSTGTIVVGGAQAENATFPSSFIQTPGSATVARNADALTYPSTGWLSQSAGTMFAQFQCFDVTGATAVVFAIHDGTTNERYDIARTNVAATGRFLAVDGGVVQANINTGNSFAANATAKLAGAYAANDFAVCLNGGTVGTDSAGTLPTVTTAQIGNDAGGSSSPFGPIRRVSYYNTRLANATLRALTS